MIPYYGTRDSLQQKNSKSIKEYKIWVLLVVTYGKVVQFGPYEGAEKGKQVFSTKKMLRRFTIIREKKQLKRNMPVLNSTHHTKNGVTLTVVVN